MPIVNRIAALSDEMAAWRHDFHENPELLYEVHRTAGIVADRLREFGCDEVVTGIGRTGVVGVIRGRKSTSGKTIGLRADMDALPIEETSGVSYASKIPGKMHACGHDGHTAMLLGAAKYLAETRNFDGTAVVIFQPAEEGGAGGKAMVDDGLMTRWGIQEVYGLHNMPGLPEGHFHTTPGAMLASADKIEITVHGKGGHAGSGPHRAVDSVLVGSQIVNALQSIVSRNVDPLKSAVISITMFQAGTAFNIIPETAKLGGTVRTLDPAIRDLVERRISEVADSVARAYGGSAEIKYTRSYPVTVNHAREAGIAAEVARDVVGADRVNERALPLMGSEDFAFMLEARPGAFIFLGMGDGNECHHPGYKFNDNILGHGASYWVRLIEKSMPAG
ncbi:MULTISPECIES: M20 aminoacylase family protein [unclassified Bradyrhizobium]|uniref:M20 aminoacylase family protein n=1 Tax=unclassified Bradyrhizobium TaxID=2631580 RepID=UPI001BAAB973|nr:MULTISPECIES: M20 aminoacylase family protein [unclassified Bradyrhizobium]MBR1226014.1 amidohydrolase [Bradyrhizobium sp. AUGA SZCCT0176]MBR1233481.1 amidohydrolase [Bradyrhizobium sp. AUGA SZCCT0182]MBR1284369.1 amidohydrolase [Bradyrhizobium sp. AUGA SZCCT0177]MBR1296967.1 amidohydrolase [Bradyrhizobium sp. AUGA SZCCT0042]